MEHHPIPQDITGFQFKLIGEMTVKQFAYIATGAILAVVAFYAPLFLLLKVPLAFLCAGFGAALAFLPVEGRPLDTMLSYYIKALLSPTQYIYQKTGRSLPQETPRPITPPTASIQAPLPIMPQQPLARQTQQPLSELLATIQEQNRQANRQAVTVTAPTSPVAAPNINNIVIQTPTTSAPTYVDVPIQYQGAQIISMHDKTAQPNAHPLPSIDAPEEQKSKAPIVDEVEKKEDTIEKEELVLQKELATAKLLEQQQQTAEASKAAHTHTLALEEQLHEVAAQKASLEQEIQNLKKQLASQGQQVMTAAGVTSEPATPAPKQISQQVRQVSAPQARAVGLPQVNEPNIIAGVVKDPRGNVLPNILVEIMDQQNNPVRAFKTNQLGQFLSATKLPNGTYKMSFEDPKAQHTFEVIEIVAKGDLLLPLEIVSQDAREALRRELFNA